jgi:hypothetical protein
LIHTVNLFYPRSTDIPRTEDEPVAVQVGLDDVRAADVMTIDYDFDRDGYRIRMPTVHEWEPDDVERDPKLVEVAFVPARIQKP